MAGGGRTVLQAARDSEVSWPIAQAAFAAAAKAALPKQVPAVEPLGIDESRRGKAKFRLVPGPDGSEVWEVGAESWHIGFVDPTGGAGLLGQVEGRTAASVSVWIQAQSRQWRHAVRTVAIDMCTVFKAAVCDSLPHAVLAVDRFHVAQLANTALTEVRRRVTLQVRGRRGRKGNREWDLRNRLTRSAAKGHADHLDPMVEDLEALPKSIGPALAAWNVKEDLMNLLALHGIHPHRDEIVDRLVKFYASAAASGLPEMEPLATTVSNLRRDHHGHRERCLGEDQPADQGRRPLRLGLSRSRQPAPARPTRHHPTRPWPPRHAHQRQTQPAPKAPKALIAQVISMSRL